MYLNCAEDKRTNIVNRLVGIPVTVNITYIKRIASETRGSIRGCGGGNIAISPEVVPNRSWSKDSVVFNMISIPKVY